MPAVAIELGRMTNQLDMDILADAAARQLIAAAIGRGVVRFLEAQGGSAR